MKRIAVLLAALFAFTLAGAACKKQPPPPPPPPAGGMPGEAGAPPGMMGGGPEKKVIVPDAVKASWKAVKIEVDYKKTKTKKVITTALNTDVKVPDTDITLKVGPFLPHFAMTADSITSTSNNLENPVVGVDVVQGGKIVFHGWLFQKFPDVHSFQSDTIALKLVEGIKK